jgi:nicotinic acid mononucleotide adenylyltransferase
MNQYLYDSQDTIQQLKQIQALLDQLDPEAKPQALIVPGSPQPRGTIIVFPGSFNPPTIAHLALLKQAREFALHQALPETNRSNTVLVYAAISRHIVDKEHVERPLMLDRIMLLQIILQRHLPGAGIMLFNRGLYVEQAEAVRTSFPEVERLFFLIGFDKIVQILDPRYYDNRDAALNELFKLAELLVAPRGGADADDLTDLLRQAQNQPFAQYIHALPFDPAYRDISSTRIRQQADEYSHDVPKEVQRFIRETHVYEPPVRQADGTEIDYYGERVKALEALLKEGHDEK